MGQGVIVRTNITDPLQGITDIPSLARRRPCMRHIHSQIAATPAIVNDHFLIAAGKNLGSEAFYAS